MQNVKCKVFPRQHFAFYILHFSVARALGLLEIEERCFRGAKGDD
jgi:hypothetical protein